MTPDVAKVRARLETMIALAEAAMPAPSWHVYALRPGPLNHAAFIAAASPDRLLRVAREALGVLDWHKENDSGWCDVCDELWVYCPEVESVLRAWGDA